MTEKSVGLIFLEARVQDQVSPCFGSVPRYKVGAGAHYCKSMWQSQYLHMNQRTDEMSQGLPSSWKAQFCILKTSIGLPSYGSTPSYLPRTIPSPPGDTQLPDAGLWLFLFPQSSHGLSWNCPIKQGLRSLPPPPTVSVFYVSSGSLVNSDWYIVFTA